MIKIINIENAAKEDILTRDIKLESGVEAIVADIIKNVRENGDAALREFQLYRWDKRAGEDRVIKEYDHAMDEIRYFAMSMEEKERPLAALYVERGTY